MNYRKQVEIKTNNVLSQFQVDGDLVSVEAWGSGHINQTFLAKYNNAKSHWYILQRINRNIFPDIAKLMENIARVSQHLFREKERVGSEKILQQVLTLVPTRDNTTYIEDKNGECWRVFDYISDGYTIDEAVSKHHPYEAAKAFAQFHLVFSDFDGQLHEVLPNFHNTPLRMENFIKSIEADSCNRAINVKKEISYVLNHESLASTVTSLLETGMLPQRIVHNDTKINNVLFDRRSHEGICVLDLDTVMSGSLLYDFGDMVRSMTSKSKEDEQDLEKVEFELPAFDALARGYLEVIGETLVPREKKLLSLAGQLVCFELGIRFLTDYLEGDKYFQIARPLQNLDRSRRQFRMLDILIEKHDDMEKVINNLW